MTFPDLSVFALGSTKAYGERVARTLGVPLAAHEERDFEDGEQKIRPLESVRGRDTFVVDSLHGDACATVNDKLCRLLFFIGALRDASAGRVTAVVPYLCYARKDRRTKPRDPVTIRYVAQLFEAVGVDRVVTMDVHNLAAFQNAFRLPTEHLEARGLFVDHVVPVLEDREPIVVSPDAGGVKRADRFRELLAERLAHDVPMAFLEKYRSEGMVSGGAVVGDVTGRVAVIVDDLISSGTTMARAAQACRARGAVGVLALATHGVFAEAAAGVIADPAFDAVIVTDTVGPGRGNGRALERVTVLDSTALVAHAIDRLHTDRSLVDLRH